MIKSNVICLNKYLAECQRTEAPYISDLNSLCSEPIRKEICQEIEGESWQVCRGEFEDQSNF